MSVLSEQEIYALSNKNSQNRLDYLVEKIKEHGKVWILADDHGAVMFNTDDEDFLPVWPHEEIAKNWCNQEWENCNPIAINLDKWLQDWTPGLEQDEVLVLAFPNDENEAEMLDPYHFHQILEK